MFGADGVYSPHTGKNLESILSMKNKNIWVTMLALCVIKDNSYPQRHRAAASLRGKLF